MRATLLATVWMIRVNPGSLVVIVLYLLALVVILWVSPRYSETPTGAAAPPFWRNVRFWASFVAVAQILVYAIWG
jgi:hypothetical protein